MLQRRRMDHIIHPAHGHFQPGAVAHVADEIAHEGIGFGPEGLGHLVLLQLVAAIDDQFLRLELGADQLDQRLAERTGAAGDQDRLAVQIDPRRAEIARIMKDGG